MKTLIALAFLSFPSLAAAALETQTLQMDAPITSAVSGLQVTVMANPVGTIPALAQYAPRVKAGIMVLIKNSTALASTDTYLLVISYRDGDKTRQLQTVVARMSGVNASYTSAIVWIDPRAVQWIMISQARTVPMDVQFGPTAQFDVLGDSLRLKADSVD